MTRTDLQATSIRLDLISERKLSSLFVFSLMRVMTLDKVVFFMIIFMYVLTIPILVNAVLTNKDLESKVVKVPDQRGSK